MKIAITILVVLAVAAFASAEITECQICETAVTWLENEAANNKTDYELLDELEGACDLLPASYAGICKSSLEQYGPEIIQLFQSKTTPSVICGIIRLCGSNVITPCDVCEDFVTAAEAAGSNNSTDYAIYEEILKDCALLPSTAEQDDCKKTVEAVGPKIIAWLESGVSPVTACTDIGICGANATECNACEWLVGAVEMAAANNATDYEILDLLKEGCNDLPAADKAECVEDVDKYGPLVIKALQSGISPETICISVQLCS